MSKFDGWEPWDIANYNDAWSTALVWILFLLLFIVSGYYSESSQRTAPDKVTLELHVNGSTKVMAIDRDKIVSIDLYPELGAYKITYTAENLEETL